MVQSDSGSRPPQWGSQPAREVFVITRGLGGAALSWGRALAAPLLITQNPDVTKHWALLVGDSYYQLQKNSGVIVCDRETKSWWDGFDKYSAGWTYFDDDEIMREAQSTIESMPPIYDITANNCQIFTNNLMKRIAPGCRQFKTL
ncbi:hypothetical protein EV361DRAFT_908075 [Lentinula raphanica]|nr:hypothetical protein F5880DRAFT_339805 [Lentinula raphanica]KAJ3972014.1 hypothetical protein EV361DRAFT_908075 [Lentinula raphanica]